MKNVHFMLIIVVDKNMKFFKLVFIITLLIVFWKQFGKQSIDRYLDGATTVIRTIETNATIKMPGKCTILELNFYV